MRSVVFEVPACDFSWNAHLDDGLIPIVAMAYNTMAFPCIDARARILRFHANCNATRHSFPPDPLLSFQQRSLARVVCFFTPVASRLGLVAPVVVCRLQLCRTSISHRRRRRRRTHARACFHGDERIHVGRGRRSRSHAGRGSRGKERVDRQGTCGATTSSAHARVCDVGGWRWPSADLRHVDVSTTKRCLVSWPKRGKRRTSPMEKTTKSCKEPS